MKIFIFSLMLAFSLPAAAQQTNDYRRKKDGMIRNLPSLTRSLGGSFQQFNGLNSRIENLPQFETLRNYTPALGFGWMKEKKRMISDMGVTLASSMSRHRDEKSSTIRYIGFNANAGYDVLKDERITLFPLAGIGFQAYQAIFYKDNSGVNFDDVLTSPTAQNNIRSVKFYNNFWVYRAGVGVLFSSSKYPSGSIGLQAGYTGSFRKNAWRSSENQTLRNAPKDRISQFYVSLILTSKPWMMMK